MTPKPRCPMCNGKGIPHGDREWLCTDCKGLFDPVDDGDYSDRDPAARLEREERARERQQRRLRGGR